MSKTTLPRGAPPATKAKELTLEDLTKAELIQVIKEQGRPIPTPRMLARIRRKRLMDDAMKEARAALADMQATRDPGKWHAANDRCSRAQDTFDRLLKEMD